MGTGYNLRDAWGRLSTVNTLQFLVTQPASADGPLNAEVPELEPTNDERSKVSIRALESEILLWTP